MDIHQIENIIAIEREQSILKASQKLFLTQSALNQQLLRLEKELGTRLFERRKTGMIPTFAGRIYLATAHQMVDMKKETYKIIHDISEENTGEISLAYTRLPRISSKISQCHIPHPGSAGQEDGAAAPEKGSDPGRTDLFRQL